MPNKPLTRQQGGLLVKMVMIGLAVQLGVIGYIFWSQYTGRSNLVTAQRGGCERSKLDREANATGWRTAETARIDSAAQQLDIPLFEAEALISEKPKPSDVPDLIAARKYDKVAKELEVRSRISCSKVFPKAGLFP